MQDKTLVLTVGLPRSGKTTWARRQTAPIVCRNAIREALHGRPFIAAAENMVSAIETYMVKALFNAGHHAVIIDACHLRRAHRQRWRYGNWTIEIREFKDITVNQCIQRAAAAGRKDLIDTIERMDANAEWPTDEEIESYK